MLAAAVFVLNGAVIVYLVERHAPAPTFILWETRWPSD
jgi:hypothetical protein